MSETLFALDRMTASILAQSGNMGVAIDIGYK